MSYEIKINDLPNIPLEQRKSGIEDGYYLVKDFYGSEKYVIVHVMLGDDQILRAWESGQEWSYHLDDPNLDLRGPIVLV